MLGVLPVFAFGGLAVQVRADLGLSAGQVGVGTAVFFGCAAAASLPGGLVCERRGAHAGLLFGAVCSLVALAGIATVASSAWQLLTLLAVGGVGNGVTQPSANLALSQGVRLCRQGLAFATKQSAMPAATLLGGLAVPVVGLTIGWRWAFAAGALLAFAYLCVLVRAPDVLPPTSARSTRGEAPEPRPPLDGRHALLVLAIAGGLASAAANATSAYLVVGAVEAGISPGPAGILYAGASALAVGGRLSAGARADRRATDALRTVCGIMAAGAVGYAILAVFAVGWAYPLGALLGFGVGWSWPGLFNLAVVRRHPGSPGRATGLTQTGVYVGGVVGPLAVGALVSGASFHLAWAATAGAMLTAGLLVAGVVFTTLGATAPPGARPPPAR